MSETAKPPLLVKIASPRGFCAGVDRAIEIVELSLHKYGAPVYVRHEIVHNKFVVDSLKAKGAVFVEELDEVPDGVPVVFSAHGVPKAVPHKAAERGLNYLDATCPLVSKVHRQAERQVEPGHMTLVETVEDVGKLAFEDETKLSFLTQTTLSVDDTAEIIAALKARFPAIVGPKAEDICYATSNRQAAVKVMADDCDLVLVIGAPNSSNSLRLVEVAEREGTRAKLIQRAVEIELRWFEGVKTLGLTAGASAPEILVREVVDMLGRHFDVTEERVKTVDERITFKLPRALASEADAA